MKKNTIDLKNRPSPAKYIAQALSQKFNQAKQGVKKGVDLVKLAQNLAQRRLANEKKDEGENKDEGTNEA